MSPSLVSAVIFIFTYIAFIVWPHKRKLAALGAALLLVALRVLSPREAFYAVNWNVMGIFVGTLAVADIFMESRVPAWLAEVIVDRAKSTCWAILFICALTGFISAFVENVATVLIVAPIALALAKKLRINPMNMMIAIAISSNLQGTATLIGDPPSMLLGGFAKMNFMDFFFYHGKPSIFFAVELGALASLGVLFFVFRSHRQKMVLVPVEKVRSWVPTVLLVGLIVALAASSFIDKEFSSAAGILCMAAGFVAVLWKRFSMKAPVLPMLKGLDWDTTFFLVGVFILIGSITATGWITRVADGLAGLVGTNLLLAYVSLVVVAVIVSAFVDNVPFLAAMLPVALVLADRLSVPPHLFLFGLLIGASLGGNITPIGASANIVACGLLKKEGYPVRFYDFAKIGLPFTVAAVAAAGVFVWFIWSR